MLMSSQYRRPRGTPTVALNLFVAPDVKELIDTYAARANVPQWAIVEAAIRAGSPDATGLPAGWTLPSEADTLPTLEHGGAPVRRSA
jgi:hypothetical protein